MNIEPDGVLILLQVLPFLATLVALHFILFRPMLAYLEARRSAVLDVREEAQGVTRRAEDAQTRLEARLSQARVEGAELRTRLHAEAAAQRSALLQEARALADTRVTAALGEIATAREAGRTLLRATASALAADIASTVLDRPVQGSEPS